MSANSPRLGPASVAFPGHKQGVEPEVEQLGPKSTPVWDVGTGKDESVEPLG